MILYNLLIIIYICFSFQNKIKNGIYNLITENSYLYYNKRKLNISENLLYPNSFFRIKKVAGILNNSLYNIEDLFKNLKLSFSENKELNFIDNNTESVLWSFININENNYVIKNNDNCYIIISKYKVFCDNIPLNQALKFKIVKIFSEVKEKNNSKYNELLNKEPIDILIKYIDLKDPNLNRDGIHQIGKDYDNEELRYSVRSILDNIPWVRKIFILMPNERVRYFKEYNLIQEKIIYVKDKQLLGYDSSNCNAFLYRYWKMKEFGISDNIIIMDDDCFIGNKLQKSDFFYVRYGKVVPLIITSNFIKIDKISVQKNCELYEKKAYSSKEEQNNDEFIYSKYLTFSFILNLFNISLNESIYIPKFTHNAIPVNLKEIKEIYDLTYKSKYKYASLDCSYRIAGYLQFQIFIQSYTFIKYNRKVKNILNKFIQLRDAISADYNNISLFCINKGSGNYTYLNFYKAKIAMEYLFPVPSPYEITDLSLINVSFNVANSLDKLIMRYENKESKKKNKKIPINLDKNLILFIVLLLFKLKYGNYSFYYCYISFGYYFFQSRISDTESS